jgi:hypothetical protein
MSKDSFDITKTTDNISLEMNPEMKARFDEIKNDPKTQELITMAANLNFLKIMNKYNLGFNDLDNIVTDITQSNNNDVNNTNFKCSKCNTIIE